ncbi:MAG: hypothetical protein GXO57_04550 [Thermodesulfobacteria bacterium]|nr:hypothetical protein [Thermodesulfobacteriota bacterium]
MKILCWTPVICDKKGFPKNGSPYLPGKKLKEAIESALVYYYIKKDKALENRVKHYLLKEKLEPEEVAKEVKKLVWEKQDWVKSIKFPEKIPISKEGITERLVEVFDLEKWRDVEDFKVESFKGEIELEFSEEVAEKLKAPCMSYAEALAKMEASMLKDHPLVEKFYHPLLNQLKRWKAPIRLGLWTEVKYEGNLLFFWRIKEVRERILRDYGIDIRPKRVLFFPREKATAGWCEITW